MSEMLHLQVYHPQSRVTIIVIDRSPAMGIATRKFLSSGELIESEMDSNRRRRVLLKVLKLSRALYH